MADILAYGFMQKAIIAGILVAITASYYGVFIVQRGESFLGDGLAHAAFGGVALGLLLGHQPLWVAVPFTVIVAILITWVRDHTNLSSDTVIGIFFALCMALGIIFISRISTFTVDAFTYLFGSILNVSSMDIWAAAGMLLVAILVLPLWGRWAYATIDREAAMADKVPVKLDDYILATLIAVTIVISAKVIGIILISAFIVIPAASARLVSLRFLEMTIISVVIGITTVLIGLLASVKLDTPSGATIILAQTLVFIICLIISMFIRNRK
jgi:zinc transport system permease protein